MTLKLRDETWDLYDRDENDSDHPAIRVRRGRQ